MSMKAEIFVVNIDNYFPELCELSIPTIHAYADKIGAKFSLITERLYSKLYPELPVTVEKLQASKSDADYVIIIDADMLIHPNFWDVTKIVPSHMLGSYMVYNASNLYEPHMYFDRFGEYRGIATNFLVVPKLWAPVMFSTHVGEMRRLMGNVKRKFILDEYILSLNAAKYGAKLTGVMMPNAEGFRHINFTTDSKSREQAVAEAKEYIQTFNKKIGYAWTR